MPRVRTEAELSAIRARVQADPRLLGIFSSLTPFLQASEYEIVEMMVNAGVWSGPVPNNPNPGVTGSVEFGLFDYWLNNPGDNTVLLALQAAYLWLVGPLPVTLLTNNYSNLWNAVGPGQPGLVASDGSWFSESKYGGLDLWWAEAFLNYLYTYGDEQFAKFATTPQTVTLRGASSSQISIALVGDWGTGNYQNGPAASVMNAIVALKPDYIVHLGDVYYSGTTAEETANLVNMWPPAYAGKSFTLNSNHEMYFMGATGYFGTALANNIFSLQKGTSYFALQYGNPQQQGGPWTIVGLDSAYYSNSPLIMDGSISDRAHTQAAFLNGLVKKGLAPQNTIVLTHHNPVKTDGSDWVNDGLGDYLWAQVTGAPALNGTPKAWYWGHVHNGIVYPNPNKMGAKFFGRCVGHGALPFGNAWGLQGLPKSQVQCYANTWRGNPNPNSPPLMKNGFVLLTITQGGKVTETFYQQDGTVAPWFTPNTYQLGGSADA